MRVGTIFENSPIALDKWFVAIWLIDNAESGISSYQLARSIGVTQKSAWFVLRRVRLAMQTATFKSVGDWVSQRSSLRDRFAKFLMALIGVPTREIDEQEAEYHKERRAARARADREEARRAELRRQRAEFALAHQEGMAGLACRDLEAFGRAVRRERAVIETQRRDIRQRLEEFERWKLQSATVRPLRWMP